jgi:dihydrofolate reductase
VESERGGTVPEFVYYTSASLNGFIADERNSLDWLFAVPDADPEMSTGFLTSVGIQVMGSATYTWLLEQEDLVAQPAKWAEFFGDLPTAVLTSRSLPAPEGVDIVFLRGPVADHAEALVARAGDKDVWIVGGGDVAGQFLDAGRLDRVVVTVAPALLASGAPLLPRTVGADRLRLESVERVGPFAMLAYAVRPA